LQHKIDLNRLVDDHGDYLYRFALVKVRSETIAEDMVQETYLAAVKSLESYKGKSTERTWLTAILKHKIMDHYRKYSKEENFDDTESERLGILKYFKRENGWSGFWNEKFRPARWNISPEQDLENKEFYEVLEKCLTELPDKIESVFRMRELDGEDSKNVQEIFNLSPNNYWIIMHRARLSLRSCIEINWFRTEIQ